MAKRSTTRGSAREEMLARVWDLIAEGGVGAFSIRDAAAGVSVGTVTYHFAIRERPVNEAFAALAERHNTVARVAITSARTGTRDVARTTLVYALDHPHPPRASDLQPSNEVGSAADDHQRTARGQKVVERCGRGRRVV